MWKIQKHLVGRALSIQHHHHHRQCTIEMIRAMSTNASQHHHHSHINNTSTHHQHHRPPLSPSTVDLYHKKYTQQSPSQSSHDASPTSPVPPSPVPPLVVIHGLFGSHMNFSTFSRQQSREWNRDCYCIDMRNHGSSGHDDYDMSLTSMAHDLERWMDEQQMETCDLLGFSLGGKLSMSAVLHPHLSLRHRISRLVIGDIAPIRYHSDQWDIPQVMVALEHLDQHLHLIRSRHEADDMLKNHGQIANPGVRSFLLSNLVMNNNGNSNGNSSNNNSGQPLFHWKFNLRGLMNNIADIADFPYVVQGTKVNTHFQHYSSIHRASEATMTTTTIQSVSEAQHHENMRHQSTILSSHSSQAASHSSNSSSNTNAIQTSSYVPFDKPTLFLIGEKSRLLEMNSPQVQLTVNTFFPQNKSIVFENCGHWIHTENPTLFKQSVEQFLNQDRI